MKVLNLYSGIGGNRKLWTDVEVTAVEYNPKIADIYKDFFPNDTVIIGDAHQYLLEHYKEFDFVWSSPPCPTHSRISKMFVDAPAERARPAKYPDMKLYQEIIFLTHFFKGKFCVENVIGYYEPLIKPVELGRHYFWSNFKMPNKGKAVADNVLRGSVNEMEEIKGFSLAGRKGIRKDQTIRNSVNPIIGLEILNAARNIITEKKVETGKLF